MSCSYMFLIPMRLILLVYLCACLYIYIYIYTYIYIYIYRYTHAHKHTPVYVGLHASFFGSTYKHTAQKMYKPWIYERGSTQSSKEAWSTGWFPIKTGATHGEPLSAADLLSSDKTHIALILQWLWHKPGLSLSLSIKWSLSLSLSDPRCVTESPSREKCLALK